jgi:hypothetical protein
VDPEMSASASSTDQRVGYPQIDIDLFGGGPPPGLISGYEVRRPQRILEDRALPEICRAMARSGSVVYSATAPILHVTARAYYQA